MKPIGFLLAVILVFLLVNTSPAPAFAAVTIGATDDSFVRNSASSANFDANTDEVIVIAEGLTPTSITIMSLQAISNEHSITLQWETASEVGLIGFNLYRSVYEDGMDRGLSQKVNKNLLPTQAAIPAVGTTYQYIDSVIDESVHGYYYWLEEVYDDTHTERYGPTHVLLTMYSVYLPIAGSHETAASNVNESAHAYYWLPEVRNDTRTKFHGPSRVPSTRSNVYLPLVGMQQ